MSIEDIQAAYYMVAATGVLIAAVFYILNLRISQRNQEISLKNQELSQKTQELMLKAQQQTLETRQAQLLMGLLQSLVSQDMMDASLKLNEVRMDNNDDWNRISKDDEKIKAWMLWASYYQGIGTLVKNGLIDASLPAQLWGGNIVWFWERYESVARDNRVKLNWPGWGQEIETLYNSIIEYGRLHPESGLERSGRYRWSGE